MLKNYLIILLRFMTRQRGFSIINITGLTVGITCSLLILLYVQDEMLYDRFHTDADHIYRLGFKGKFQGKQTESTLTGFPVAEAISKNVKGVASTIRLAHWATFPVRFENKTFTEPYLLLADKNFFRFFSFRLVEGHPDSVLNGDRKVVMSESAAKKYFNYTGKGDRSPIGKTIELAQGYTVQISGIAEDPPRQSHFHFSLILSLSSWEISEPKDWLAGKVITYYKIGSGTSHTDVNLNVRKTLQQQLDRQLERLRNTNAEEFKKQGNQLSYFQQRMIDIHLHSDIKDEIERNGKATYIYLFSSIAVFITLLACINFMNLTTAQSSARAKEVAVRKAVGAQNDRLIGQFLLESYLYVTVAVILAFFTLLLLIGPFNYFTGKQISISSLLDPTSLAGIFLFVVITGLVAGSYPAFYLTHFSPVEVLKGNLRAKLRSYGIRNVLVVFQFFISSGLIIATLVVYRQLQYVDKIDLGFNKENIINILHTKNLGRNSKAFKDELLQLPEIISASYCNRLPPNLDWQSVFRVEGEKKDYLLAVYETDHDHLKTMGYTVVSGRFFSPDENDSLSVLLNETAARKLGVEDYLDKKLFTNYDQPAGREREIIGIVKDFNFQSLKNPIQPLAIILGFEPNWEMAIRIKSDSDLDASIAMIEKIYKKHAPTAPFEYSLLEKNFDNEHKTEKRVGLLFLLFTSLAIIIACLGLFGLTSFTAEQLKKSIGIRKVMGATVNNIVVMLNRDFLKLVLIANLLVWPAAWWMMDRWLGQFAYHTGIPWWVFAVSGLITALIACFSISFKAYRAASGNPVNSLRNE
jgi:putative ABC transport system permease protein